MALAAQDRSQAHDHGRRLLQLRAARDRPSSTWSARAGLKLHDFAALVPVVEGAGGTMCDWNGEPLHAGSDGHVLALGDPARLEDVLEALGGD